MSMTIDNLPVYRLDIVEDGEAVFRNDLLPLIAAAPAMLLALQELIAEREEYNDTGGILLARDAIALTVGGAE